MIKLTLKDDNIIQVRCSFSDNPVIKTIPGHAWNGSDRAWEFTYTKPILRILMSKLPGAEIDPSLLKLTPYTIINTSLFPYQLEGVKFLLDTERALLADEMGLGKTIQAIAACQARNAKPILIICPNTLKWTWKTEIEKWHPGASWAIVEGDKTSRLACIREKAQYTIVNFEMLAYDRSAKQQVWGEDVSLLVKTKWDTIIIDEAHRIKNRKAQVTKAVHKLKSRYMYELTGTPILNRAEELWSLLNILYPSVFTSYWRFVERYCEMTNNGWGWQVGVLRPEMYPELKMILDGFSLRRLKSNVLKSLPGKLPVEQIWIRLSGQHRDIYDKMEQDMYAELSTGNVITAPIVLAQITRLKQIAIDPTIMLNIDESLSGPKVDALFEIIDNTEEKVVVFSQFARVVDRLGLACNSKGIKYVKITGEVTGSDREVAVQTFQADPAYRVFLCGIKSGGVGITLTAAHIAVFMDKYWSPAINWQAQERLDRIGQTEKVSVIEILASDTIEERIEQMLDSKTEQFGALFDIKKLFQKRG